MIFVDTGAFLARFIAKDQFHEKSLALWKRIEVQKERCFTTNFILDETATFMARRAGYQFSADKVRLIYSSGLFEILRPTNQHELAALDSFEKFADQEVSFTDCISFVLMREAGVETAFSFDSHFERAGFKIWK